MALSEYDKVHLSQADQDKISSLTDRLNRGEISRDEAHAQAEAIRGTAGYSGGEEGTDFIDKGANNAEGISLGGGVYLSGSGGVGSGSGGRGSGGSYGGGQMVVYDPVEVDPITFEATDLSQYLKDLYAQNTAAQLESLKSAYDQNVAELDATAEKIPKTFQAARNETAAQSELERRAFNEYAAARGLNTGTSGQAALASSAELQGNLSDISGQEADALSQLELERQQLAISYRDAIAQAQAAGQSALAQALYEEYVRQDNMALNVALANQDQSLSVALANGQNQLSAALANQQQGNWQAEFGLGQQQYADSLSAQNRELAYNLAMTMLGAGVMPDAATLSSAGISSADAQAMIDALRAQQQTAVTTPGTGGGSSGGGGSGGNGNPKDPGRKDPNQEETVNSDFIAAQVSEVYRRYDLRNMTAEEIYGMLRQAGYDDAVIDSVLVNLDL